MLGPECRGKREEERAGGKGKEERGGRKGGKGDGL
jgi:hypothetical protein